VNSARKGSCNKSSGRNPRRLVFDGRGLLWLSPGVLLLCGSPALAQPQQSPSVQGTATRSSYGTNN